jgi:hypothetical protein
VQGRDFLQGAAVTALEWIGICMAVFASAAAYDWANAHYVAAAAEGRPLATANWSAITAAVGLVSLLGILRVSPWLAVPEIAGFYVGTYAAVSRRRK